MYIKITRTDNTVEIGTIGSWPMSDQLRHNCGITDDDTVEVISNEEAFRIERQKLQGDRQ